jgi:CxxC motif-containing protein (DUF1111 family)
VRPEASIYLDWQEVPATFADGEKVTLRKPRLRVEKLTFGPLGPEVMYSLRIALPTFGLGLLEAVGEADILAIAERQKSQGVNGRPNYVWDAIGKRTAVGRFGWKSNQPSIKQQIAAAALGDLGVTSPLYDKENCPPVQVDCAYQPPGNQPELVELNWDELEFWTQTLAVPARRNVGNADFRNGERGFAEAKCAVCHVPEMQAGALPGLPQIKGQVFHPYTDLLVHDMGDDVGVEAFTRQQTAVIGRSDSRPTLAWIKCPTLVLTGDQDNTIPNALSMEMASGIPGAKLVVLPNCGHMPQPEQPQATAEALTEWLRS